MERFNDIVRRGLLALALACCAPGAFAEPIQLLRDINRTPKLDQEWDPRAAQLGTNYVTAVCANGDCEPWITNGTPGTLRLLKAIRTDGQSARANGFTTVGDKVFFIATAPDNVYHVWMTDGTDAGTVVVPLPDGVLPNPSYPVAGLAAYFFFTTNSGELWRTDGTLAGAALLASGLNVNGPPIIPMATAGGWVYFAQWRFAGDEARELWKTDGTPAGTTLVKDITPGPDNSSVFSQFTVDGNKVYFFARGVYDPVWQLYVSDGTDAGTFALATAPAVSTDRPIVANGIAYYFKEIDPAGIELWRTDGTPAGTAQLAQWPAASFPHYYWGAAGGRVYFGIDPEGVTQTWSSDGTPAGTQMVKPVWPNQFVAMGGAMYFGNEFPHAIWRTEGSPATTTFVAYGDPQLAVGEMLFLTAFGSEDLWTSDGTPEGSSAFLSPAGSPSEGSHPSYFSECNAQQIVRGAEVFFVAYDGARGCQLWKSDGTPGGTALVRDLSPLQALGTTPLIPALTVVGDQVYFFAVSASDVFSLWRTDGSEAGTVEVKVLGSAYPNGLVAMGGNAYFAWGGSLWKSDGTTAGTATVKSIGFLHTLTPQGNQLFFIGNGYPDQLWRSDGTTAGTSMLATGDITNLRAAATQLFFINTDGVSGSEPWRSDGTVAGTRIVKDVAPGVGHGAFYYVGVLGDVALFAGVGSLWRTDGTTAGTQALASLVPSGYSAVLDDNLYFGVNGSELWRFNGMSASMVADNVDFDDPGQPLVAAGGSLYVIANTTANGNELFVTSGAPGPLTPVDEFITGPMGMRLYPGAVPVALPNGIFFQAGGRPEGVEPYVLPLDTTPSPMSFTSKANVTANSTVTSNPVQVTGIDAGSTATVSNGQVCVSFGASCSCDIQPFGASRPVRLDQYICLRHVAGSSPNASVTSTLSIGGMTASFTSTVKADVGVVEFSPSTYSVSEGSPSVTLTVTRTGVLELAASVNWTISPMTAVAGTDYTGPTTGTITWSAGDGAAKTIVIPLLNDAVPGITKVFTVDLSSPINMTLGGAFGALVNLLDSGDVGFYFAQPMYTVAESSGSVTLQVMRAGASRSPMTVKWTTANGTALAGQDFGVRGNAVAPSGTLTWAATDMAPRNIVIPILQDLASEGSESFTIVLSAPSAGAIVGVPGVATVTISDDDIASESLVSFSQGKYLVLENAGNAVLTVHRQAIGAGFTVPAAVNYATQPGTALAGSDYTTRTGTLTWATGDGADKTITIPIVNDAIAEVPESFKVTLTPTTSGINLPAPEATVTIIDDDDAFPKFGAVPDDWTVPSGANAGWHATSEPGAFEGVYSLRSDAIEDGQVAQVEVTRAFAAGNVSFRVKVSSEPNFDKLRFFVDGIEKGSWSGTAVAGWTLFTTPLTAGNHTLRWSYEKDGSASVGSDAAWIDAVTLP